jgi:hypothetical protein
LRPAPEFEAWLARIGITDETGQLHATAPADLVRALPFPSGG